MKIVFVLLLILLPHILQLFQSFIMDAVQHSIRAYAQKYTSDKGSANTATGIRSGITTESELPSAIALPALPKSQQFQILHKKPVPLLLLILHSQLYKKGSRIALIVPVFTGAAYNHAFYIFYKHYATVRARENVTAHLFLLSSLVTKPKIPRFAAIDASAYAMRYLDKHLSLLMPKNNVSVLTDIDVDSGLRIS